MDIAFSAQQACALPSSTLPLFYGSAPANDDSKPADALKILSAGLRLRSLLRLKGVKGTPVPDDANSAVVGRYIVRDAMFFGHRPIIEPIAFDPDFDLCAVLAALIVEHAITNADLVKFVLSDKQREMYAKTLDALMSDDIGLPGDRNGNDYEAIKKRFAPGQWAQPNLDLLGKAPGFYTPQAVFDMMLQMNRRYAVVDDGKVAVFDTETKQEYTEAEFHKSLITSIIVEEKDAKGDKTVKKVKRSNRWFYSPARTVYIGRGMFPLGRDLNGRDYTDNPETRLVWNTWRGWGVEAKEGDCSLFLDHLLHVVCNGNEEHYNYVLDWMAHRIQRPWEKPRVALVLWSPEKQTGKSLVGELFRDVIGVEHSSVVNKSGQVLGRFSDLTQAVFCQSEEALFSGNREIANGTKDLITNAKQPVEHKCIQGVKERPNYTGFMFTSNDDKAVHVTEGEERFFVLRVSASRKGDKAYFQKIYDQQRKKGGAEALLYMLQRRSLKDFKPWAHVPKSHALGEMALEHAEPLVKAILDAMRDGAITVREFGDERGTYTWHRDKPFRVTGKVLLAAFGDDARAYGEVRGRQTAIGKGLRELGLVMRHIGADHRDGRNIEAAYVLVPLNEAFRIVAERYGVTPEHLGARDLDQQADQMAVDAAEALDTLSAYLGLPLDDPFRLAAKSLLHARGGRPEKAETA